MADSPTHPDRTKPPQVYLVGAGPGDPGLLTLRAVECLQQADVVIHDKLVSMRILDLVPPTAQRIAVTSIDGEHPQKWPHIQACMLEAARAGKRVVRLKGGDPLIFGRGAEEAALLAANGLTYEIVPGITAGLAAGAYAEIPVTQRLTASACALVPGDDSDYSPIALVTGHENPTKPETCSLDWEALARFPGTLVIYMGLARLQLIVKRLLELGKDPDTPCAAVQTATTGHQRTVTARLADFYTEVTHAGLTAPVILYIGPVVSLKPPRSWFEARPLYGQRVLVTRPRAQASELMRQLELLGAVPYLLPVVSIEPLPDYTQVDATLRRLRDFDWLVFTSVNGVEALLNRLLTIGLDLRALGHLRIAAIGPATAAALARFHLRADLVPERYQSEDLAAALREPTAGQRVLLARADRGRDLLRHELARTAQVEQLTVYIQRDTLQPDPDLLANLERGEIPLITLTSSNIARALLRLLRGSEGFNTRLRRGEIKLISISPVTTATIAEMGYPVAAEAAEATIPGVIDALIQTVRVGVAEID
jgi:uroporphyrinogen III methyltransferase/synthase